MDHIRKALSEDKNITVMAIDATQTVQESLGRLKAFPPSMVHLGQAMLAALLLQTLLGQMLSLFYSFRNKSGLPARCTT